jgi:hypothetical protein
MHLRARDVPDSSSCAVVLAQPDLIETHTPVEAVRGVIGDADLEQRDPCILAARHIKQVTDELASEPACPEIRMDAKVQQMTLAGAERHDAVTKHTALTVIHLAVVTDPHAVAEYGVRPWKVVRHLFDRHDRRQIALAHFSQCRNRPFQNSAHADSTTDFARHKSSHTLRLSTGLRSK